MDLTMSIRYQTEFSPRLSSVNVSVQKPSPSSEIVSASIPSGCDRLLIRFSDDPDRQHELLLSHKVSQINDLIPHFKQVSGAFTIKIPTQLSVEETLSLKRSNHGFTSMEYRWSKKHLTKLGLFSFDCNNCGAKLLHSSEISKINDMPSENWAEMMDFWHCHKPSQENEYGPVKSKYNLQPDINGLLIGSYYLMLHNGIESTALNRDMSELTVNCSNCEKIVGYIDSNTTFKIFNWNLKLTSLDVVETFEPYNHAHDSILDMVNSSAVRIITIESEESGESLNLWIFSIGVSVTLEIDSQNQIMQNCIKILYTDDSAEVNTRKDKEDLVLPNEVFEDCVRILQETNQALPDIVSNMGSWKIGFLPSK